MAEGRLDGRVERGNRTRRLILERAARIASVEGLESLSLGRLATELELSKSGVFTLFGSKRELQLATVRAAAAVYREHVVRPALEEPPGLGRVWRLCAGWLEYSERRVFPGGCFFGSVTPEFDAREGEVHDALAAARRDWVGFVEDTLGEAAGAGALRAETDTGQLAFEIVALLEAANAESVLHGTTGCYGRAATGIRNRLAQVAAPGAELPGD
ncbi:TetR family transcriptional regulator [Streptomyces sp. ODS28]|uniref:TetR/AcrR family transcriptional regulator n=1 Tax=Streptomyces sp. ODS28 TaxID=3136688 RepID=UPI0031E51547